MKNSMAVSPLGVAVASFGSLFSVLGESVVLVSYWIIQSVSSIIVGHKIAGTRRLYARDKLMAVKKSELYSSLWASCDELRGGMDASQYKDYVLVLLFVKYISDRFADEHYAPITIPKGASFADMVALKGKPDIGDKINK